MELMFRKILQGTREGWGKIKKENKKNDIYTKGDSTDINTQGGGI